MNLMKLKWAFLPEDTECNYEIASNGLIISKNNFPPTPVKTIEDVGGLKVRLHNIGGKKLNRYVHNIVAECFIPNPDNLPYVIHKDGNKWNNNVENLEWSNVKEGGEVKEEVPQSVLYEGEQDPHKRGPKKKYNFATSKEYHKWWQKNNREKYNEYQRKYRSEHKDVFTAAHYRWIEKNKEKYAEYHREYQKKYRELHRDEINAKSRERALKYYYEHREEIREKNKLKYQMKKNSKKVEEN